MHLSLLAIFEPTLNPRDQRFFELGVTLIPVFFLAGTIATAARAPRGELAKYTSAELIKDSKRLILAAGLITFVYIEISAVLNGVEALVSGVTSDYDRHLMWIGLLFAILGAGISIIAPWIAHFFRRGKLFRTPALLLSVLGVVMLGSLAVSSVGVYDAIFGLTHSEIEARRFQARARFGLGRDRASQKGLAEAEHLVRLNIVLARLCRIRESRGLFVDQKLALGLVESEIRNLMIEGRLNRAFGKKEKAGDLSFLKGSC